MSLTYLLISPFDSQLNGVNTYIQNAIPLYPKWVSPRVLHNHKNESIEQFRETVCKFVVEQFGADEIIIEAPETRSAALLLPPEYRVHTRMHTPLAVCEMVEGRKISQQRFSDDLRAIAQATVATSPSYGLLDKLGHHISRDCISVFKNGITSSISPKPFENRNIDVIFMGRFDLLKGSQYLNALLHHLPETFRVALIGKGAGRFNLHSTVKCAVETHDHINGDRRFEYLTSARVAIIPSLFENCSMMMLEALKAHVPVVSWRVGGNSEFPSNLVRTVSFDNIQSFATSILQTIQNPPDAEKFEEAVNACNEDFRLGAAHTIERLADPTIHPYRSAITASSDPTQTILTTHTCNYNHPEAFFSGKKILGFTISNEHIEEMWAPVAHYLGVDYRFICRRPLGFHSKFKNQYKVSPDKFNQFDWTTDPDRLISMINEFKPDILLTHNGLHPSYQRALQHIKMRTNVALVYSELGWFPQADHIYFDRRGTNGSSNLSAQELRSCDNHQEGQKTLKRDVFIPLQLNSDTNLKVSSPRFRRVEAFLEYTINQLPADARIHIKPHPLDLDAQKYFHLSSDRIKVHPISAPAADILNAVGHVVGINSTVLLEALKYDVNIYTAGKSLLDNKGVAISLLKQNLRDVFSNEMKGTRQQRNMVIEFFAKHQVNVTHLPARRLFEEDRLPDGLRPLAEAVLLTSAMPPIADSGDNTFAPKNVRLLDEWGSARKLLHRSSILVLGPALTIRDRHRLKNDPIDFFRKAKWGPNRFFGRLLLDKSQRPY